MCDIMIINENVFTMVEKKLFLNKQPVYINKVTDQTEDVINVHSHNFIEIAYVHSGSGIHQIGTESYIVNKGDIILIQPGTYHRLLQSDCCEPGEFWLYNCIFSQDILNAAQPNNDYFSLQMRYIYDSFFDNKDSSFLNVKGSGHMLLEIDGLFDKMLSEQNNMQKGYYEILRSYLLILLVQIFRLVTDPKAYKPSSGSSSINSALNFIKSNYNSFDLNLDSVALSAFMSKNYFSKIFKETTGQNFTQYIQNLRISFACELLANSHRSIADIMEEVGYKDIKHFNILFRKITGKTPSEFRKDYR